MATLAGLTLAEIASMLEKGVSLTKIANRQGVSRQALSQYIQRKGWRLRYIIEDVNTPKKEEVNLF